MKTMNWPLAALAIMMLIASGCSKKSNVDTAPIENSFSTADPTIKSLSDQTVSAIKSADYSGAMADLQKLAAQSKLTPEQRQAVKDVLAQVQNQLSDSAAKAGKDAQKAAGDLQKSLPKP